MRFRYTPFQIEWLRREYPRQLLDDLTATFNAKFSTEKTSKEIKSTLKNHSITCGRPTGLPKGTLREFTREQYEFVEEAYKTLTIEQVKDAFNERFGTDKTHGSIRNCTRNHKILSGRTGYFEAGIKAWNSGTKGLVQPNKTSFTAGHLPANHREVGSRRISKDGYLEIKIKEPRTWRAKHLLTWEEKHGPVSDEHMIKFIDGDKTHIEIDNLELVSRAENMILNQMKYSELPENLKESARLVAKVIIKSKEARDE